MTERFNALTVVLTKDIRDDDAEAILCVIRQLRGVLSATGNVSDISSHVTYERVRRELGEQLLEVLYPKKAS